MAIWRYNGAGPVLERFDRAALHLAVPMPKTLADGLEILHGLLRSHPEITRDEIEQLTTLLLHCPVRQ